MWNFESNKKSGKLYSFTWQLWDSTETSRRPGAFVRFRILKGIEWDKNPKKKKKKSEEKWQFLAAVQLLQAFIFQEQSKEDPNFLSPSVST